MQIHDGHRQRMYEKLKQNALLEHEWLEVLLFSMQPRKNTNEIAHRLLRRFGSTEDVLAASMDELQSVDGVGVQIAAYLKCVQHFYEQYKKDMSKVFQDVYTAEGFLPFVKKAYEGLPYEVVDLYLLDGDSYVIKKQGFSIESISTVLVKPETLSAFLLTEGARGVVMVHNHPCGVATPSGGDDAMTQNMQVLCSMHNLLLCDHVIYAPNGLYSYYLSKRMVEISKQYSFNSLMNKQKGNTP